MRSVILSAHGLARLARPFSSSQSVIAMISCALAVDMGLFEKPFLFSICSVFFLSCGAMAANDYVDFEIDVIDKPNRPIPSGQVSRQLALLFTIALHLAGLILAFFVGTSFFTGSLVLVALSLLYAGILQKQFLLKNTSVSAFAACCCFLVGLIRPNPQNSEILLNIALFAFFSSYAREIYKDIEHIKGDKFKKDTLPLRLGVTAAKKWADFLLFINLLIILRLGVNLSKSFWIGAIPTIILGFISTRTRPNAAHRLLKYAIIFVFFGIILASL